MLERLVNRQRKEEKPPPSISLDTVFQNIRSAEEVIVPYIDEALLSLNEDEAYRDVQYGAKYIPGIHASQVAGERCVRRLYWVATRRYMEIENWEEYVKISNFIGAQLRRIFENGSDVHTRIQRYLTISGKHLLGTYRHYCKGFFDKATPYGLLKIPFKNVMKGDVSLDFGMTADQFLSKAIEDEFTCVKCGEQLQKKTALYYEETSFLIPELHLSGKVDGVLQLEDGSKALLEIKSINRDNFQSLLTPLPKHIEQTHIYMLALGLDKVVFLYECKDNQVLKEYVIPRNEEIIKEYKSVFSLVADAISTNTLPAKIDAGKEFEENNRKTYPSECTDCEYRVLCWGTPKNKGGII